MCRGIDGIPTMIYTFVALVLFAVSQVSGNCEYGRTAGLFRNKFQNGGEDDFVPDLGEDDQASYGDSATVTFDKKVNIFSAQVNTLKIYDSGLIYVDKPTGGAEDGEYNAGDDPFNKIPGQSFISPMWWTDGSGSSMQYRFTYKHLKLSELQKNGLEFGPSMCDLQRIEKIIFDCNDAGQNLSPSGDSYISEALIVTWQIKSGSSNYYMQAVVAVDAKSNDNSRETYVIFLYLDMTGATGVMTGFVNGKYSTTAEAEFAAVCPFSAAATTELTGIHMESNCRCGSWNQGIFVFKTRDDLLTTYKSNTCLQTTKANLDTECAKSLTLDNTQSFQLACRPRRKLQDTCIEDVFCVATETQGRASVTISMHNPRYTSLVFLNPTTLVQVTSNACKLTMTDKGSGNYQATIDIDTGSPQCSFEYTAVSDTLKFALMTYDSTDTPVELVKGGTIILKGTCEILNNAATNKVEIQGLPTKKPNVISGRKVEMFVNDRRDWNPSQPDSKFDTTSTVDLARDIYLAVCYNTGDAKPVDGAEPYGVYVKGCSVSNNPTFSSTGTNRLQELTTADGCRTAYAKDSRKAFFMEDSFIRVYDSNVVDVADYNFCQMSGAINAAKWLVGGSDKIYFRCNVGFCRNLAFKDSSRCEDTCANANVDYVVRKRRDVNETSDSDVSPYPDVTLETSIRVIQSNNAASAEQIECVDSTVAIATVVTLMILLLFSVGITSMMFCKVRNKQKKI